MANPIKFGTDGWRAVIADDFTFENVRYCAQGFADYLKAKGLDKRGIAIGYDYRFASEDFAATCAEVMAGNGIRTWLSPKAIPTPQVVFTLLAKRAGGGVIITASHNPARWNGFKVREETGVSISSEVSADVEKYVNLAASTGKVNRMPLAQALEQKRVEYLDMTSEYLGQISRLVDSQKLRNAGYDIIIDSMYGAGCGLFRQLLGGGTNRLTEINGERNPAFPGINPEPIAPNLKKLSAMVVEQKANVGMATDGDADRIGIIDEKGNFITQLQTYALLALYLLEVRGERGAIIKTVTSTSMLDRLGEIYKVPVYETPVGFKYVAPLFLKHKAIIGGEESGGYGFRGHVPERDSLPAGLYILDFMRQTGKAPSQLLEYLFGKVGPHYYDRIDLRFPTEAREQIIERVNKASPQSIAGEKVVRTDTVDGFRFFLKDHSWLLIRFSGTEPVLRIYTETGKQDRVQKILQAGKELTGL
ncbi:MAG: phosphoglucomutase/phosphomannomutase family protein [Dehalococcoidia bacterium]|nr:phosphoglucomutase/phosphomannomutase family protein [Dehalococcoidia bacterium]